MSKLIPQVWDWKQFIQPSPRRPFAIETGQYDYPVRAFESMADVRGYYWGPPKPDAQGQSRIAAFVTVGSLRGWGTCGGGPSCR